MKKKIILWGTLCCALAFINLKITSKGESGGLNLLILNSIALAGTEIEVGKLCMYVPDSECWYYDEDEDDGYFEVKGKFTS